MVAKDYIENAEDEDDYNLHSAWGRDAGWLQCMLRDLTDVGCGPDDFTQQLTVFPPNGGFISLCSFAYLKHMSDLHQLRQFNALTVTGRVMDLKVLKGQYGESLVVTMITTLETDGEETNIVFTNKNGLMTMFKNGNLDTGRTADCDWSHQQDRTGLHRQGWRCAYAQASTPQPQAGGSLTVASVLHLRRRTLLPLQVSLSK